MSSSDMTPVEAGRKSWRLTDWLLYAVIAGLLGMLIVRGEQGPKTGTAAQAFSLPLIGEDGRFRLAEQRGKPVLIEVFASWCGACENAAPMMQDVYREAQERDVVLLGVSIDDDARAAQDMKRSWPIPYPVAMDDGSVKRGYGVSLVPTFVLIDRQGTIKRVSSGVPSRRTLSRWMSEL